MGHQLLLSLAGKCHVRKILVCQQILESQSCAVFKLVPSQVEMLRVGHGEVELLSPLPVSQDDQERDANRPAAESLDNHN